MNIKLPGPGNKRPAANLLNRRLRANQPAVTTSAAPVRLSQAPSLKKARSVMNLTRKKDEEVKLQIQELARATQDPAAVANRHLIPSLIKNLVEKGIKEPARKAVLSTIRSLLSPSSRPRQVQAQVLSGILQAKGPPAVEIIEIVKACTETSDEPQRLRILKWACSSLVYFTGQRIKVSCPSRDETVGALLEVLTILAEALHNNSAAVRQVIAVIKKVEKEALQIMRAKTACLKAWEGCNPAIRKSQENPGRTGQEIITLESEQPQQDSSPASGIPLKMANRANNFDSLPPLYKAQSQQQRSGIRPGQRPVLSKEARKIEQPKLPLEIDTQRPSEIIMKLAEKTKQRIEANSVIKKTASPLLKKTRIIKRPVTKIERPKAGLKVNSRKEQFHEPACISELKPEQRRPEGGKVEQRESQELGSRPRSLLTSHHFRVRPQKDRSQVHLQRHFDAVASSLNVRMRNLNHQLQTLEHSVSCSQIGGATGLPDLSGFDRLAANMKRTAEVVDTLSSKVDQFEKQIEMKTKTSQASSHDRSQSSSSSKGSPDASKIDQKKYVRQVAEALYQINKQEPLPYLESEPYLRKPATSRSMGALPAYYLPIQSYPYE